MRTVVRFIFVSALLLGFVSNVRTQSADTAILDGVWILNKKQSDSGLVGDRTWEIISDGKQIRIRKICTVERKASSYEIILFPTRKDGETNTIYNCGTSDKETVTSKSSWDKNKLIRRFRSKAVSADVRETYQISKDRKQLIFETSTINSFFGYLGGRMVFDRGQ